MKKNLPCILKLTYVLLFLVSLDLSAAPTQSVCPALTNIQVSNVGMHEATVTWDAVQEGFYEIHVHNSFDEYVEYVFPENNEVHLTGLYSNTRYTLYLYYYCDFDYSDVATVSFTTYPDCNPASNVQLYPGIDSVYIEWDNNTVATYLITLKKGETIITGDIAYESPYYFTGLTAGTEYEIIIDVMCEDYSSASSSHAFSTLMPELNYCTSSGADSRKNHLQKIMISNLHSTSGDDHGYADRTQLSANVTQGEVYSFNVQTGGNPSKKHISAWIDYNQDGDFDESDEQVTWLVSRKGDAITTAITIPESATVGSTRLRVSVSQQRNLQACGIIAHGETEDYTINIQSGGSGGVLSVYPNPVKERLYVKSQNSSPVTIMNSSGKIMFKGLVDGLDVADWPEGIYYLNGNGRKSSVRFLKANN